MMMRGAFNFPPNPTPPVQPQPIPTQPVQQSEPDDDVEVVPETQPPKQKGKRKKGKQVVGDKPKAKPWTPIEEEALAKAYIGTSIHLTKGWYFFESLYIFLKFIFFLTVYNFF
ncbi:hypothetical protein Hanom_Chr10g00897941 [Helianthus anomalus]